MMYAVYMDVPITRFRRELFNLVNQAMEGTEVSVIYKGQRFKIVPEALAGRKLDRITPMQVIRPGVTSLEDAELKEEMQRKLEEDWKTL